MRKYLCFFNTGLMNESIDKKSVYIYSPEKMLMKS